MSIYTKIYDLALSGKDAVLRLISASVQEKILGFHSFVAQDFCIIRFLISDAAGRRGYGVIVET